MGVGAIVVGVDGSQASRDALRWALEEARVRGTAVEAVHVWRYPVLTYAATLALAVSARAELQAGARALLDHEVDQVVAGEYDPPPVERVLLEGTPGRRLADHAAGAALLVVGRRRRGFPALLPGSVAQRCSASARCPVVVVARHPGRRRELAWPEPAAVTDLAA